MDTGSLQIYRIDSWGLSDTPSRITTMLTIPSSGPIDYHPPCIQGTVLIHIHHWHSILIVLPLVLPLGAPTIHLLGILHLHVVILTISNFGISAGHTLM